MASKIHQKTNGLDSIMPAPENMLHHFAFNKSAQANIITTISNGKIITVNKAACQLLGYSKQELLSLSSKNIFDVGGLRYKRMLKQRKAEGQAKAEVEVKKKSGVLIQCQITTALFIENGVEKSITTLTDLSAGILKQKKIDAKKEKTVADNIVIAKLKQKDIDLKKEKIVADNLLLAIAKQIRTDVKNAKIVADNIAVAIADQKAIDVKNAKIVAENILIAISKQIEIDEQNKKIVADNIAIAIAKQKDLDTRNAKIVADNIAIAISKQKNIDIKNAKIVANNIALAISKQKDVDVVNSKIVADNILLAISRQIEIDEHNKKIVANNIAFAISKQKDIDINNAKIVADNIILAIAKQLAVDATFKKKVAHNTVKALIKSKEEKRCYENSARKLITEAEEKFKLLFNASTDVLYDNDLITGIVIVSDTYEKEYGHKLKKNMTPAADWVVHIHPDDKEATYKDYTHALQSKETVWKQEYRFLKRDGSIVNVISNAIILRDAEGKAVRVIGSMHDRDKEKKIEERLEREIKLKDRQIEEAMEEAKDAERSEIGKELHDNVNQLLGASKLYLEMAKMGGADSELYLHRSTQYTITAINEIRKLSHGLTTDTIKDFGLCDAIENVAADTMAVSSLKISCTLDNLVEKSVSDKFKLNVFRIVQEQLNNIIKHALATDVAINLSQNKKSIILIISDNGVGFDTTKNSEGIGIANVKSRATAYSGEANFVSNPGNGCVLKVKFPLAT